MKKTDIFQTYDDLGLEGKEVGDKVVKNGIVQDKASIKKDGADNGKTRD